MAQFFLYKYHQIVKMCHIRANLWNGVILFAKPDWVVNPEISNEHHKHAMNDVVGDHHKEQQVMQTVLGLQLQPTPKHLAVCRLQYKQHIVKKRIIIISIDTKQNHTKLLLGANEADCRFEDEIKHMAIKCRSSIL